MKNKVFFVGLNPPLSNKQKEKIRRKSLGLDEYDLYYLRLGMEEYDSMNKESRDYFKYKNDMY